MEDYRPSEDCVAACETLRAVVRASEADTASGRLKALGAAGVLGLLAGEAAGGSGLQFAVAAEVMREAGALGLDLPLADTLLAAWVLDEHPAAAAVIAGAEAIATAGEGRLVSRPDADGLRVSGRFTHAVGPRWVLAEVEEPATALVLIDLTAGGLRAVTVDTFDQGRSYDEVSLENLQVGQEAIVRLTPRRAAGFRLMRHVLHGAEMLGGAQACFEAAKEHVSTRRQFGKLLASHQSVRHQLARDHLRLTVAALSIAHAAALCDEDPRTDAAAIAVEVASSTASEASLAAVQNGMQLHGALSFTWDAGFHRYLRRVQRLGRLHDAWTARAALGGLLWRSGSMAEAMRT